MSGQSKQESWAARAISAPVYPVLLTSYYVVRLYSENTSVFHAGQLVRPVLVLGGAAMLCLLVLRYVLRMDIHKAVFGSFAVAFILTISSEITTLLGSASLQMAGFAAISLGLAAAAFNFRPSYRTTVLLNAVCLSLLVQPAFKIVKADILPPAVSPDRYLESVATGASAETGPSFVHIVLDGYSRADVLAENYGYDNRPFLNELEGLGFTVFDGAHSPYNQTTLNLTAVFSGTYLDPENLTRGVSDRNELHSSLARIFGNSPVLSAIRQSGYRTLTTDAGYAFSDLWYFDQIGAPAISAGQLNLFETRLLARSGLGFLTIVADATSSALNPQTEAAENGIGRQANRLNVLLRYALESPVPSDRDGKFFLYQHILAPHPPFTIDREGRDWAPLADRFSGISDGSHVVYQNEENRADYIVGYREKLIYTNSAVLARLQRLIGEATKPLIVVVHGDHGGGAYYDQDDLSLTCASERFSPLLAIYASDPAWRDEIRDRLSGSPNLVNIYRAIFAAVYDVDISMLEDSSYYMPWNDIYGMIPVDPERRSESCGTAANGLVE